MHIMMQIIIDVVSISIAVYQQEHAWPHISYHHQQEDKRHMAALQPCTYQQKPLVGLQIHASTTTTTQLLQ